MKRLLVTLVLSLITGQSMAGASPGKHQYIAIASGSTIRLLEDKMQIVIDGHSVVAAVGCPQKPAYKCLASESGAFVFPTRKLVERMTWEFEGQYFEVVRKVSGRLLGRAYSGFIVQSLKGPDRYWYLLSSTDGLLAFGAVGKPSASTFVLEGKCGFAATDSCKD